MGIQHPQRDMTIMAFSGVDSLSALKNFGKDAKAQLEANTSITSPGSGQRSLSHQFLDDGTMWLMPPPLSDYHKAMNGDSHLLLITIYWT
ncbi:hypothetical protein chiPu_0001848 [Chiloscyllium punctatum]|uniref:Uncharacterized protein n=1 Tax=Chiloscyllium punctatum TaxID=137246 RepID=A0A401RZ74_CHIPU|nr:hypothetical protein [Chiloscyllium punctatum]